jgi:long-subunit acyl-CoA synthetase (AMP-forming)
VPLYETLGDDMLKMILEQTEISTLFGSDICLLNILKLVKGKVLTLKHIVSFDEISKDLEDLAKDMGIETILYHESI